MSDHSVLLSYHSSFYHYYALPPLTPPSAPTNRRHLSPVCMDFMRKLLVKDPNMRMSTGQALRHPFITGQVRQGEREIEERWEEEGRDEMREVKGSVYFASLVFHFAA
jgi:serine/threonine protein kinase